MFIYPSSRRLSQQRKDGCFSGRDICWHNRKVGLASKLSGLDEPVQFYPQLQGTDGKEVYSNAGRHKPNSNRGIVL